MATPSSVQSEPGEEENLEDTLFDVHLSAMLEGFFEYLNARDFTDSFGELTSAPAATHNPGPQRRQRSRVPGHVLSRPHELLFTHLTLPHRMTARHQPVPENEPDQFTADDLCQMFAGPESYDETVNCAICCDPLKPETDTDPAPTQPVPIPVPLGHTQAPHVEFNCKHRFHTLCIRPWLIQKRTCPVCRGDVFQQLICQ